LDCFGFFSSLWPNRGFMAGIRCVSEQVAVREVYRMSALDVVSLATAS
jgi:hypothetical protein